MLIFIFSVKISAQTGLGVVGMSTSNKLWLRSEDIISLADGDDISLWSDFSGNGNDHQSAYRYFNIYF